MSLWQIAQAAVLISTSPGPGSASSTVSTVKGRAEGAADGGFGFHGMIPAERRNSDERLNPARGAQEFKRSLEAGAIIFCGARATGGEPTRPRRPERSRFRYARPSPAQDREFSIDGFSQA